MSEIILFVLVLIVLALVGTIVLLLRKKPVEKNEALTLLQQQMGQLSQTLDTRLAESNQTIQNQFNQSAKIISEVYEKLGQVDQATKQVIGHTEKILTLENILKNPKQRGILGEFLLENLLKNILPAGQYQKQYNLGTDEATGKELIVDAVIFADKKIIPIDSKFSLENYNRLAQEQSPERREELEKSFSQDLKNRIDETSKYVQPQKGTMDFALMFIPADGVYSDLLDGRVGGALKSSGRDLIDYAHEKRVTIVSPTTFYAILMTILQGLRGFKIEKFAQEIKEKVELLSKHLGSYEEYMKKLGNNLGTTVSAYNNAYKEFGKIDKDIAKITDGKPQADVKQLDKPLED
ncbi:MAG: DNA recombination protein RmuC [bacterium]|nr:DNA recombination protein RmuC [bacterium]